jgi:bis(5'-nucleosidyl)-tetraphosphatase
LIKERSAGAILFYLNESGLEYLILHYPAGHWDFPKGNVEKGEHDEDTVKREVAEETGIEDTRIIRGFRRGIEYHYRREKQLIQKYVMFYLAATKTKQIIISSEHLGYVWLPYELALNKVTFKNAKRLLQEAHAFIQSSNSKNSK